MGRRNIIAYRGREWPIEIKLRTWDSIRDVNVSERGVNM